MKREIRLTIWTGILICAVFLIAGCENFAEAPAPSNQPRSLFSADLAARLEEHKAKTGEVQASLIWNNYNDLDLHIVDPLGKRIFWNHKRASWGGELDVDMNAGGRESREPVENIYFPQGRAPDGLYRVYVHYYAMHDDVNEMPFRCEVMVYDEVHKFNGRLLRDEPIRLIYSFTLGEKREEKEEERPPVRYRLFFPIPR